MNDNKQCPLCTYVLSRENDPNKEVFNCNCPNCGKYSISHDALHQLEDSSYMSDRRYLASGFIREMNEKHMPVEIITTNNFQNIFNNSHIPNTIMGKLNKLIQYLYLHTDIIYSIIEIDYDMPSIAYAHDDKELREFCITLMNLKFIRFPYVSNDTKCHLTIEGIQEAEKYYYHEPDSNQCFVALWFTEDMENTFNEVISKSIYDSGYKPFIIPMKEHNEDIFDHIILEIKKSKFLIADFTGSRGGVYYEAGYAHGLGIPVIYTCREDWFNKTTKISKKVIVDGSILDVLIDEERIIHFDINHLNFIVWKDKDDLYNRLTKRIQATIS